MRATLLSTQSKNAFTRVLQFLDGKMTEPTPFGWFHLLFLTLVLCACIFVGIKAKKLTDKQVDTLVLGIGIALILLEIYKQMICAYDRDDNSWHYSWGDFPFQFCSTPLYILPWCALAKQGRVKSALSAFLATYCLIAGTVVMLTPTTVFSETIGINLQTMLHHGAMIIVAVLLLASGRVAPNKQSLVSAICVFISLCAMAMTMNGLYIAFGNSDEYFNLFYISPAELPPADFLEKLLAYIPYPVYLGGYLVFFTLGAYLVLLITALFTKNEAIQTEEISASNPIEEQTTARFT